MESDGLGLAIFPFGELENDVSELSTLACYIMTLNKGGKASVVLPCGYAGMTPCPVASADEIAAATQRG